MNFHRDVDIVIENDNGDCICCMSECNHPNDEYEDCPCREARIANREDCNCTTDIGIGVHEVGCKYYEYFNPSECVCKCPSGLIVDRDTNCPCSCHMRNRNEA